MNINIINYLEKTVKNFSTKKAIIEGEKTISFEKLNKQEIYPRRYFYPSLNKLDYVEYIKMPISESIAPRILCLPLYDKLSEEELTFICNILNK